MSLQNAGGKPDPIREAYEQALKCMKAGDLEEAEHLCRRAVVRFERNPNLQCLMGEICLKQQRPAEGRTWFDRALKQVPDYPRALEGTGKALLAEKKPNKAVSFLQRAAQALPDRVSTHLAWAGH